MAAINPNQSDIFQELESFPYLSGKVSNTQADVFQLGESLRSLAPTNVTTVTITVPSGQIALSGDAATATVTAFPPSGTITVSGDAPAVVYTASPASGVVTVSGSAPTLSFAAFPPAGLITVTANAPTAAWLISVPSGQIVVLSDAPTLSYTAKPPAGTITVTADAPLVTDTETIPSGTITVSADAPSITDFSVVTTVVTTASGGNKLFGPPRKRPQPARQVLRLRIPTANVYAQAFAPQLSVTPTLARATVRMSAAPCTTALCFQIRQAPGILSYRAMPDQRTTDLDRDLRDLVRDVVVALEA